jgi:hypothetical protein
MIPREDVLETFACPVRLRTNILRFGPAGYDIYSEEQLAALKRSADAHSELLFAVCRKFEDESRHDTALRYIREAEERATQGPACEASSNSRDQRRPTPDTKPNQ